MPRVLGNLARSGYKKDLHNGVEIGYSSPYSAAVEFGAPFRPFAGEQVVNFKGHRRQAHERRPYFDSLGRFHPPTFVKAHEVGSHQKIYTNQRLVGFKPKHSKFERGPMIFRILKGQPPQKGQYYLTRAYNEKIGDLPQHIGFYLSRIEGARRT